MSEDPQLPPVWIKSGAADLIWMEDESTRGHEGHETARQAWERIFGDTVLNDHVADEGFDGGDCFYHRYEDGRIYVSACDADEIRFLKSANDDPALQGYECCGRDEVGKPSCGWHGEAPAHNSNCPICLGHAYPRMMLYGRRYPNFRGRKPITGKRPLVQEERVQGPIPALNDPRCNCSVPPGVVGHTAVCGVFAPPPSRPPHANSDLRASIRDSLWTYWDGPKPYLRFVPVESAVFRHGLSLNVSLSVDRSDHDEARNIVADYLTTCYETLTGNSDVKLTFGGLDPLDRFVWWPQPGDNSGHGGYLKGCRLFTKVNDTTAITERGTTSTMPATAPVIKIVS